MYSCYLHNWYSHTQSCPVCDIIKTSSSGDCADYLIGMIASVKELKKENAKLKDALDVCKNQRNNCSLLLGALKGQNSLKYILEANRELEEILK